MTFPTTPTMIPAARKAKVRKKKRQLCLRSADVSVNLELPHREFQVRLPDALLDLASVGIVEWQVSLHHGLPGPVTHGVVLPLLPCSAAQVLVKEDPKEDPFLVSSVCFLVSFFTAQGEDS